MARGALAHDGPVIEIEGLSCGYGTELVLQDVHARITAGQLVGLVGPSGAGKTTLLRALLGQVPRMVGRVRVLGREVRPGAPPPGVAYVPQLETVDWNFPVTVEEVVLMGRAMRMRPWPWPGREDRRLMHRILDRLGIGSLARRHIRELSGGQQQRVFLARALISEPQVLLLDEPTSGVDVKTRDEVLHLLGDLNRDGMTIVLTTHELNAVAAHLPWVLCINGSVIAQGDPDEVFTPEVLWRTYGAAMQVVRQDGLLLVADAAPHRLREQLRHRHAHRHGEEAPHEHEHAHGDDHHHHHRLDLAEALPPLDPDARAPRAAGR
jgi:zinc/manganese transport system ATP-binding protein